jgi:SAM-dependent methyltransferase
MTVERCPGCGSPDTTMFMRLDHVPVHCNVLWPTPEAARDAPRGDIRLRFCRTCGLVYNDVFDPTLTQYQATYENSLHFSPRFQEYARWLAAHLTERYDLAGGSVVEIGCGKGEFLELLCDTSGASGVGFDTTYEADERAGSRIRVIRDFYSEAYSHEAADLICCRQTLEHIADPRDFLAGVRRTIGDRTDVGIFFEVPNALVTLRDLWIWDIIYEHCSYFTLTSLRRLFEQCEFVVEDVAPTFGDQFLTLEARPATSHMPARGHPEVEIQGMEGYVRSFGEIYRSTIESWEHRLSEWKDRGDRIALWGAGSKGVTFLNTVRGADKVASVVDVNPRKHGKRVPGTAQEVVPPSSLRSQAPDAVLVMNPIYESEIRTTLHEQGLDPDVIPVRSPGVKAGG